MRLGTRVAATAKATRSRAHGSSPTTRVAVATIGSRAPFGRRTAARVKWDGHFARRRQSKCGRRERKISVLAPSQAIKKCGSGGAHDRHAVRAFRRPGFPHPNPVFHCALRVPSDARVKSFLKSAKLSRACALKFHSFSHLYPDRVHATSQRTHLYALLHYHPHLLASPSLFQRK